MGGDLRNRSGSDHKTGTGCAGIIPVHTISFLSGCTVLSMSAISVGKNLYRGNEIAFDKKMGSLLAFGAAAGGVFGKALYQTVLAHLPDTQRVEQCRRRRFNYHAGGR